MILGKIVSWVIGIFFLLILLSLLFGSSGWYTRTVGIIAGIFFDYGHIGQKEEVSVSPVPKTFDNFIKDFDSVVYSNTEQCIKSFTMPDDFGDYKINFKKTSDGAIMTITTKDAVYGSRGRIDEMRDYKNLKLCVIYPSYSVYNFIKNLEEKRKDTSNGKKNLFYSSEEFSEYDEVEIVDGKLHIISVGANLEFEKFYLFKPDANHVCFMPNSEHWYNSGDCTPSRDVIDPNCWDEIVATYPTCAKGSIKVAVGKGLSDMVNFLSVNKFPFGSMMLYPIDVINDMPNIDTGIPASPLLVAIMYQESRGKVNASSGTGAIGAMQITQGTASWIGKVCYKNTCDYLCDKNCKTIDNRNSIIHSILGGYWVYKDYYDKVKGYSPPNTPHDEVLKFAMAAYNGGPGVVKKAIDRSVKTYGYATWDNVKRNIKPMDIPKVKGKNGKVYFATYAQKKAKVDEILNYVSLVSAYYEQARGVLMARGDNNGKENKQGNKV